MSEFERARREKRRAADQPKPSLAIVSLANGQVTSVPRVRSFRTARESGEWVAYLLEPSDSGVGESRRAGFRGGLALRRPTRRRPAGSRVR